LTTYARVNREALKKPLNPTLNNKTPMENKVMFPANNEIYRPTTMTKVLYITAHLLPFRYKTSP